MMANFLLKIICENKYSAKGSFGAVRLLKLIDFQLSP
jgi:hypothetical protein